MDEGGEIWLYYRCRRFWRQIQLIFLTTRSEEGQPILYISEIIDVQYDIQPKQTMYRQIYREIDRLCTISGFVWFKSNSYSIRRIFLQYLFEFLIYCYSIRGRRQSKEDRVNKYSLSSPKEYCSTDLIDNINAVSALSTLPALSRGGKPLAPVTQRVGRQVLEYIRIIEEEYMSIG